MEEKKLLFIVNPRAGQRRTAQRLAEMIRVFSDCGWNSEVYITSGPGDATEKAALRAGEFGMVACAGGDGTLNEVISGVLRSGAHCQVGYIPAGTTNDFAATVGLSTDMLTAARDLATGSVHDYDVGSFNGRNFVYIASFGAFTKASYSTPQIAKNLLGHLAYLLEGMREVPLIKPIPIRAETESGLVYDGEYLFGAISNSKSVAGLIKLSDEIVGMDDGVFEVMLIRPPQNATQLNKLILSVTRGEFDSELIDFFTASRLSVTAPRDMSWTLDGECAEGAESIEIVNIPRALHLAIPGGAK